MSSENKHVDFIIEVNTGKCGWGGKLNSLFTGTMKLNVVRQKCLPKTQKYLHTHTYTHINAITFIVKEEKI